MTDTTISSRTSVSRKPRLLFYCQHVLGMGHFTRSIEIVKGLSEFDVFFLNGGDTIAGFQLPAPVEFINLPPLQSDAEFRALRVSNPGTDLNAVKTARQQTLLEACDRIEPDVAVIELFPFGRRKFGFELIPLLERLKSSGAKVVCSLRDILVSKHDQARFEEQACQIANQYFDSLLIHSDPRFHRFEDSFGSAARLTCDIRYTGFVVQQASPVPNRSGQEPLIVASVGGGRVGGELIESAIQASAMLPYPHKLRAFAGPYIPEEQWERIKGFAAGSPTVTVERYSPHLLDFMAQADLSISMAGYNTCMNVLCTGVPSMVYPFTGNNNEEQTVRARKLQELGITLVLGSEDLDPAALAEKMNQVLRNSRSKPAVELDINGVRRTAELLQAIAMTEVVA